MFQRMLPVHPMMLDGQVLTPSPDVKTSLMARLRFELDRRGQPMPTVPEKNPEPTPGALRRAARRAASQKQ
jgi:hypothetical protein